jgi:hypothetical protein
MATGIVSPNVGTQDLFGDYVREIDAKVSGGRNGPTYVAASLSVLPVVDAPSALDAFYAVNATAAAVTITAPVAASTKLGTVIRVAKTDASGNAAIFSAPDAAISNGSTTSSTTAQGTTKTYTLANLNGTLTWVVS